MESQAFGARPRKQLGQHWLKSEAVLNRIVEAAQSGDRPDSLSQSPILEIGPGTGALTRRLLATSAQVIAVELDRHLCQRLRQQFQDEPNFQLIEGDILSLDLQEVNAQKVVANIPYYITGPILERLLGTIAHPNPCPFESIVLLVQKEVAQRICAEPGSRIFGALTVRVQYLAACEWVCAVPAKAFYPPPKVDSAVIKLVPRPFPVQADRPSHLETLIKAGFATKRKMLRNNLKSLVERDRLLAVYEMLGIKPEARAEELSVEQWIKLSNQLA